MSLRDKLARKFRPETTYDLVVADPTEAQAEVDAAERDYRIAVMSHDGDSEQVAAARTRRDEARTRLAGCVETLRFRNLSPDDFEALLSAHPPTKEQQAAGEQWNAATLAPALIAACLVDNDMDEDEWAVAFKSDGWSSGDRRAMFNQAMAANIVPRSVSIPKD